MCGEMATAAPRPQYFGGDLRSFRTYSGLRLSEVHYGPRKWERHTHFRAFFAFLLSGGYLENLDRRQLAYRPFDLGFHPESTRHTDEICAGDTRFFLIELDEPWLRRLRDAGPAVTLAPRLCTSQDARLAARVFRAYRRGDARSEILAEGLVLELLSGLMPAPRLSPRDPPAWLSRILDLLDSEYPRRISLESVAREVGLHPVYLSRAFRKLTGRSVSQYVATARIRFATRKLEESRLSLAQIALDAGFADQSHFTRTFRRETGQTPSAYRSSRAPKVNSNATRRKG
jgi:AraC family transcriptional regulator